MNYDELKMLLIKETKEIEPYIIETRRQIHMYPETAYDEKKTVKFIEEELNSLGFSTLRAVGTGVIGTLNNSENGLKVGLRADIDALNVFEENDVPYRSRIQGKMHACGHDGHIAMLLGAAKLLSKYKVHLKGQLKLIFQPAEEGGGGGKKIVEEGHLDDIDVIFGIHLWNDLPSGIIATRSGLTFASSDRFTITLKGKGGHAAAPHQTIDPTSVLSDIYNALQKIISREINPFEPKVLALPKFTGSSAHNVIPSIATLQGTLRTLNPQIRKYIKKRIQEIVEGYSKAWRCSGIVEFDELSYPPVINNEEIVNSIGFILQELDELRIMDQTMISEDFAFYLNKTKGAFLTLGINNKEKGIIYPHHHPKFQIDESVLWKGTAIYSILGFFSLYEQL